MNTGSQPQAEKTPVGQTISIIVIVLVLVFGAFYFSKQVPTATKDDQILTSAEVQADKTISTLSTQGTSTNVNDIKKDLSATDLSGVSAGLNNIAI